MYALTRLFEGLLIAHALWAIFFVTGTLLAARPVRAASSWSQALLRTTTFTVAGMGVWAFEGFVLGFLHLFDLGGLVIAVAANAALFSLARRENISSGEFWTSRLGLVRAAFGGPSRMVYAAALILATPAIAPPFSYDGVHYHVAYPYEWFLAGRIFADPYLRFPYYALNNEVLDGWLFIARAGEFIPFLSWLAGTQAALGLIGLVARLDESNQRQRPAYQRVAAQIVYLCITASFVLSAVFLRWWPTGMTDALACAAFFAVTAALCESSTEFDFGTLRVACVCAGLLAGTKPSYLFFVPFTALYVFFACRRRAGTRHAFALVGLLFVFSSPWYVRNIVALGDPVPPIFTLLLHGSSSRMSLAELRAMESDLQPHRTRAQWALLPIGEFLHPGSDLFREYGVTLVVVFEYAVVCITPVLLLRKPRPNGNGVAVLFASTLLGLIYLACTSMLTRYSVLVYPGVAACAGILIVDGAMLFKRGFLFAPLIAALTVLPSPGSQEFYREHYDLYYRYLGHFMPSYAASLDYFVGGYQEARPIFHAEILKRFPNVLLLETPLNYYVERGGGRGVGDYVGPIRYQDVADAVDAGMASSFMNRQHVGAIVVNRRSNLLVPDEVSYLARQLRVSGWNIEPSSDRSYLVLLRSQ